MALNKENWEHSEGDHRVEEILAYDPALGEKLAQYALRFISEKGLSDEFADALEGVQNSAAAERDAVDETMEP
jgi:hypothetical protein